MSTLSQGQVVTLRAGWLLVVVVGADALSKELVQSHLSAPVRLPLGAQLAVSYNHGVAFGPLAGAPAALTITLAAACVALGIWAAARGRLPVGAATLGLVGGGAIANVIDRLPDGRVTDFIDLPHWPSFNLADVAITAAALLLLISLGRSETGPSTAPRGPRSP